MAVLEDLEGLRVDALVRALFWVSVDDLPERGVVRLLCERQKLGDTELSLTGGTLSIKGAPIQCLHWQTVEGQKRVRVVVESTKKTSLEEMYLCDLSKWIVDEFSLFVLGRTKNAGP